MVRARVASRAPPGMSELETDEEPEAPVGPGPAGDKAGGVSWIPSQQVCFLLWFSRIRKQLLKASTALAARGAVRSRQPCPHRAPSPLPTATSPAQGETCVPEKVGR